MSAADGAPGASPEQPTPEDRQAAAAAELVKQLHRSLAATAQADRAVGRLVSLLA